MLWIWMLLLAPQTPTESKKPVTLLDAVQSAAANHPGVAVSRLRVSEAEGFVLSEEGAFDWNLEASSELSRSNTAGAAGADDTRSDGAKLSGGVTKKMEEGYTVGGTVETVYTDANLVDETGALVDPTTRGTIQLSITYPLLAGKGKANTTAALRAAREDVRAARAELNLELNGRILTAAAAFWAYRAAYEAVEVARESESRSEDLSKRTQRLIEADEQPANELLQVNADLADKRAVTIQAENALVRARQALGLAMGLNPAEIANLGEPADSFPELPKEKPPGPEKMQIFMDEAVSARGDVKAFKSRRSAQEITAQFLEDQVKATLDANGSIGYTTLEEGDNYSDLVAAILGDSPGLDYKLGLTYKLPFGRRATKGALARARADVEITQLQMMDLQRTIGAEVFVLLDDIQRGWQQLNATRASIELYERAVANEQRKLALGFSTLIDLINTQDRLDAVRRRYINAQRDYYIAVAGLRFETASFFKEGDKPSLNKADVTTIGL